MLTIFAACPLFTSPRIIPVILQATLAFSVAGFLIILIILLFLRQHSQHAAILFDTSGTSGWGTGTAWLLGLTNSMYAFTSTDAAIHIAEEMVRPEKRLPQVLNMTLGIGFFTAFPLLVVMMLSMTDVTRVIYATLPYGELFMQITGNKIVTTFLMSWVTLVLFSALIGQWVTCGRLAWAFARDGGLPYSHFFAHVNKRLAFPVRTTILALLFSCCYGLLYLVSTTAFNSIITSAVLFSNISYCIPQAIVALRGRAEVLPQRAFDLGLIGQICNYLAPVFVTVLAVLICFPPELPVTSTNINYTPVVLVGFWAGIVVMWRLLRGAFKGPQIDWEVLKSTKIT